MFIFSGYKLPLSKIKGLIANNAAMVAKTTSANPGSFGKGNVENAMISLLSIIQKLWQKTRSPPP